MDSEGSRVGGRGHLATFAFYANKQLTTGEGGVIVPSAPEIAARLRSERNQGRAEDMGWLSHDRLGFNYRLTDLRRRSASPSSSGPTRCWPSARASPRSTASAWPRSAAPRRRGRSRGPRAALRGPRGRAAELVRVRGPAARGRRPRGCDRGARRARRGRQGLSALHPPDAALPGALRATARDSSPSPSGCRRARWRCPSSPAMGEAEVERVAAALAVALGLPAPA